MPFNDYYLNNGILDKGSSNSAEITNHNTNDEHKIVDNVPVLQKSAGQQECETNDLNLKNTGERWPTAEYATPGSTYNFTPQHYTQAACSTSISMAPQQQHHFNQQQQQQQAFGISRQSELTLSPAKVNTQHQQQQDYYNKPYPSANITCTNLTLPTSSLTQPSNQNQLEYLQWQQQQQVLAVETASIGRPTRIWVIGWFDILVPFIEIVMYNIVGRPISGSVDFLVGMLVKFLMSFGLLMGLKNDDDYDTLWYCRLWIPFQVLFVLSSIIQVMYSVVMYASHPSIHYPTMAAQYALDVPVNCGLLVYRIISFVLVYNFVGKLKKSVKASEARFNTGDGEQQQHPQTGQVAGNDEENRNKSDPNDGAWNIMLAGIPM